MIVNRLPTADATVSDVTRIPYSSVAPIGPACPWFSDADSDSLTINSTASPAPPGTLLVYDSTNCKLNVSNSVDNSYEGVYTVTVGAYDAGSTAAEHTSLSFQLTIDKNEGPVKNTTIPNQTINFGVELNYTLPANIFSDTEGETITYTCSVLNSPAFITFSNP